MEKTDNVKNDKMDDLLKDIIAVEKFYSSRAVAQASFFIASLFGLVAFILIIIQITPGDVNILDWNLGRIYLSMVPFYTFSFMCAYTFYRFNNYATWAEHCKYFIQVIVWGKFNPEEAEKDDIKENFRSLAMRREKKFGFETGKDFSEKIEKIISRVEEGKIPSGIFITTEKRPYYYMPYILMGIGIFILGLIAYYPFFAFFNWVFIIGFAIGYVLFWLFIYTKIVIGYTPTHTLTQ